jgi:hypothetical protein
LGSLLLQWRQAAAIDAGVAAIDRVAVTNKRAEKLYRALGFKADGNAEGFYQRMVIAPPVRISKRLSRTSCKFVTGL